MARGRGGNARAGAFQQFAAQFVLQGLHLPRQGRLREPQPGGCPVQATFLVVHSKVGFFMNWSGKQPGEGFEFHLLAIGMALGLIIAGGGKLSADKALADKLTGSQKDEAQNAYAKQPSR